MLYATPLHIILLCSGILYDILYDGASIRRYPSLRLAEAPTHGTGCTLASAIASFLSLGHPLQAAVACAHEYVHTTLARSVGIHLGSGLQRPMWHNHAVQNPKRYESQAAVDYSVYAVTHPGMNEQGGRDMGTAVSAAVAGGATVV